MSCQKAPSLYSHYHVPVFRPPQCQIMERGYNGDFPIPVGIRQPSSQNMAKAMTLLSNRNFDSVNDNDTYVPY